MTEPTRNPIDPRTLSQAVSVYLSHYDPETRDEYDENDDHEADIAFESVLLEQGVITSHECVESLLCSHVGRFVTIRIAGGPEVYAYANGIAHQ